MSSTSSVVLVQTSRDAAWDGNSSRTTGPPCTLATSGAASPCWLASPPAPLLPSPPSRTCRTWRTFSLGVTRRALIALFVRAWSVFDCKPPGSNAIVIQLPSGSTNSFALVALLLLECSECGLLSGLQVVVHGITLSLIKLLQNIPWIHWFPGTWQSR